MRVSCPEGANTLCLGFAKRRAYCTFSSLGIYCVPLCGRSSIYAQRGPKGGPKGLRLASLWPLRHLCLKAKGVPSGRFARCPEGAPMGNILLLPRRGNDVTYIGNICPKGTTWEILASPLEPASRHILPFGVTKNMRARAPSGPRRAYKVLSST